MTKKDRLERFERAAFPDQFFEEAKKEFREFYLAQQDTLQAAEKAFRNLVVLLLRNREFPEPKVSSRVKDRAESVGKFDRKYRDGVEASGETYSIASFITDLIGLRVTCIYESDIERVAEVLKDEFSLIEETDKSRELEETVSSFGYKGLHLDLKLNNARRSLPEYSRFGDQRFEVQIRSIVQDAWSEVDHRLKYKRQTPPNLQRRIANLAALFELADREFESIRDLSNELESQAKSDSTKVDEANSTLDLFGFLRVSNEYFPEFSPFGDSLDILLENIHDASDSITIANFRSALQDNLPKVRQYMGYLSSLGHSMTPYTQIRHCLYLHRPQVFEDMIFVGHRKNFDRWLEYGTVHPNEVKKRRQ